MWGTFEYQQTLYLKRALYKNQKLSIYLCDLKKIWMEEVNEGNILSRFKDLNTTFEVQLEDAVSQSMNLVNNLNEAIYIELTETDGNVEFFIKSKILDFDINYKFFLKPMSSDSFLSELTVPLFRTVKQLLDQQKRLCDIIERKDRELEEYKLEKGNISRDDLTTNKFNADEIQSSQKDLITNIFNSSMDFWDKFVEKHGDIETKASAMKKEHSNHLPKKRKIYSAQTAKKRGFVYQNK